MQTCFLFWFFKCSNIALPQASNLVEQLHNRNDNQPRSIPNRFYYDFQLKILISLISAYRISNQLHSIQFLDTFSSSTNQIHLLSLTLQDAYDNFPHRSKWFHNFLMPTSCLSSYIWSCIYAHYSRTANVFLSTCTCSIESIESEMRKRKEGASVGNSSAFWPL